MLKRHEDILTKRLEDVVDHGRSYVTWREIYRWYNVKRIDRNIWRDLKDRYQDIEIDAVQELSICEDGHGVTLIANKWLVSIDAKFMTKNS